MLILHVANFPNRYILRYFHECWTFVVSFEMNYVVWSTDGVLSQTL